MARILAIETSCDETAVAILDLSALQEGTPASSTILADLISSQIKLHEPYGGVVPELAAREHIVNLPALIREAFRLSGTEPSGIDAVAVTQGPGLKGCLLVGLCFAKAFALGRDIPLFPINHLEGHLVAPYLVDPNLELPMLSLIVSGGHTMLVLVHDIHRYEVLATTRDDAAGEAFDKIATLLGLPYPGGPALAALAQNGNPSRFEFPAALVGDPHSFSFSGLKTAVARNIALHGEQIDDNLRQDIAASAQAAIVRALVSKTIAAVKRVHPKTVALGGGVAANTVLRESLFAECFKRGVPCITPPPHWCTDNAVMIGLAAALYIKKDPAMLTSWRDPALLGPNAPLSISAESRLPLAQTA